MNSIGLVVLSVLYLIAVPMAHNIWQYIIILFMLYANLLLLTKKVKYKTLLYFILALFPVLGAILISSYLFAKGSSSPTNVATLMTLRYFCLAITGFAFAIHTPFEAVLTYMMQRKILSVTIGYPILAAFNSFDFLGKEFKKIQTAYKMRYGKHLISPAIIIPLLIASARYAHNLSVSMHSRSLNKHKTFVINYKNPSYRDYALWLGNLVAIVFLVMYV